MKKNRTLFYGLSLISLIIGLLFMTFLRRVYFVGVILLFIIVVFQTPSTKVDRTGEVNDANLSLLKVVGLNALLYLAGGYLSLMFF